MTDVNATATPPAIPIVRIENDEQFRDATEKYLGKRYHKGAKPFRSLALAITVGHGHLIADTEYFQRAMGAGVPTGPRGSKPKPVITYAVEYQRVSEKTNKVHARAYTIVLTEDDVKSNAPHVRGKVGTALVTMVLSAMKNEDWRTFHVMSVQRVETLPVAASVDVDTPGADDEDNVPEDATVPENMAEVDLISA